MERMREVFMMDYLTTYLSKHAADAGNVTDLKLPPLAKRLADYKKGIPVESPTAYTAPSRLTDISRREALGLALDNKERANYLIDDASKYRQANPELYDKIWDPTSDPDARVPLTPSKDLSLNLQAKHVMERDFDKYPWVKSEEIVTHDPKRQGVPRLTRGLLLHEVLHRTNPMSALEHWTSRFGIGGAKPDITEGLNAELAYNKALEPHVGAIQGPLNNMYRWGRTESLVGRQLSDAPLKELVPVTGELRASLENLGIDTTNPEALRKFLSEPLPKSKYTSEEFGSDTRYPSKIQLFKSQLEKMTPEDRQKAIDYWSRFIPGIAKTDPLADHLSKTALELDIEKGDTLLGGRFKNVPHIVEEIGEDENGQPTINGMKLLSFRIAKKMPKKIEKKAAEAGKPKAQDILNYLKEQKVRYAIGGSYPLRQYRPSKDYDIDVHADDWDKIKALGVGKLTAAPSNKGEMYDIDSDIPIQLFNEGDIEGFGYKGVAERGGIVDDNGLNVWSIPETLAWKKAKGRPKDLADIALVAKVLAAQKKIEKKAAESDPLDLAVALSPLAAGYAIPWVAKYVMSSTTEGLEDAKPVDIKRSLKASSLPSDYPVLSGRTLDNAFHTSDRKFMEPYFTSASERKAFKKHKEGIVVGNKFKKLPIILHEMGHADVSRGGGLSAFNQDVLRPVGTIASVAALLASGFRMPIPAKAGLLGLSALGYIPTLVSEHQATNRAIKAMGKMRLSQADKDQGSNALDAALSTYYAGALAFPVASLASLAYFTNKYKK